MQGVALPVALPNLVSRGNAPLMPPTIMRAVLELVPRDDRVPERRVFQGFGGDRFRTAIKRACVAAGVPAFSPHDLRYPRISLLTWAACPGPGSASTSGSAASA